MSHLRAYGCEVGYPSEKFVPSRRMPCILTDVRVALATSDVQSILEISATDEIHMEDRNETLPKPCLA